jgi:hypothetical protein
VAAALWRSWPHVRHGAAGATAWRFALCASLPFLAVLSVAATARDVYAAPSLLGFGLLAGLWAHDAQQSPGRFDRLALRLSRYLTSLIAWTLAGSLAVFAAAGSARRATCAALALVLLAAVHLALLRAARAERSGQLQRSFGWIYGGYVAAVCLAAVMVLPIIDRWQDLPALARRIHTDTAHEPLALLDPDETTIAMLDHGLGTRFTVLSTPADAGSAAQVVDRWFHTAGPGARVLVLLPGHAPGALSHRLERFVRRAAAGDGAAGALTAAGAAVIVQRYELPQGRRYALLGPLQN